MFDNSEFLKVLMDEPLKNHCTIKIGGKARYVLVASSVQAILQAINVCSNNNIKYKIIGMGANLLFDDKGFDGAIIVNKANKITLGKKKLVVESGTNISYLCQFMCQHNLKGLEFAFGIPSTVGGAIVNNMGAFGSEFSDLIESVSVYKGGKIFDLKKSECQFAYRSSIFSDGSYVILGATLKKQISDSQLIKAKMLENLSKKTSAQPTDCASAGSVFKRVQNFLPARAIDELRLKGRQIGGAMISSKHSGFIINAADASCKDVLELIELVQEKIFFHYGVLLQAEIEYVPF